MDLLARARTFVRVVDTGSLSKAARADGVSLAAVSRQMTSLEAELGAVLLARTTRTLRLTDEGRRFHEHAVRLVQQEEAARASVRADGATSGRVLVSTSVTLGLLRIVPALPRLLAAHPALEVALRLEDRASDLVGEGVDVAVRAGMALPDTARLVAQPLASYRRVLVGSPGYLRRAGVPRSVAALAKHTAVLGTTSAGLWSFTEDGAPSEVTVTARLRVDTLVGVLAAVAAGVGLAVLPDFVVAPEIEAGTLRPLLPGAGLAPVTAHALYRVEARGTPRIEAIVRHLRATMPLGAPAG